MTKIKEQRPSPSQTSYSNHFSSFQKSVALSRNSLALSYGKKFRFSASVGDEVTETESTSGRKLDASLVMPDGKEYSAGITAEQKKDDGQDYLGRAFAKWGDATKEQIEAEFNFKRGNEAYADYVIAIDLRAMDWRPLSIGGTLLLNPSGSLAELHWKHGNRDYRLELEHGPIESGLEKGIRASLKMNEVEYLAIAVYRFDDVMTALDVKLRTEKYFTFTFIVRI
jgi:hypothetical protein